MLTLHQSAPLQKTDVNLKVTLRDRNILHNQIGKLKLKRSPRTSSPPLWRSPSQKCPPGVSQKDHQKPEPRTKGDTKVRRVFMSTSELFSSDETQPRIHCVFHVYRRPVASCSTRWIICNDVSSHLEGLFHSDDCSVPLWTAKTFKAFSHRTLSC